MPDGPDLTDDERAAVIALLKRTIAESRYPLSPEIRTLKRALDKLEPAPSNPPGSPGRPPAPSAWGQPPV
jgi:hypothetical protein